MKNMFVIWIEFKFFLNIIVRPHYGHRRTYGHSWDASHPTFEPFTIKPSVVLKKIWDSFASIVVFCFRFLSEVYIIVFFFKRKSTITTFRVINVQCRIFAIVAPTFDSFPRKYCFFFSGTRYTQMYCRRFFVFFHLSYDTHPDEDI